MTSGEAPHPAEAAPPEGAPDREEAPHPGLGVPLEVIGPSERTIKTQQTAGMQREAGVCPTNTSAVSIWSGVTKTPPGTRSGAHHHGPAESAIYVVSGRAKFYWGEDLSESRMVEAGDFIYVPAYAIHAEEVPADADEPVMLLVSRNSGEMVTVNLDGGPSSS